MGFVKATCPGCGANIDYDDSRDFGFCQYCGAKITRDTLNIKIKGIASANSLLERAFMDIADGLFNKADESLEKVIDADPKCGKAYIGKLMTATQVRSLDELYGYRRPLENIVSYGRAIMYSSPEDAAKLKEINEITKQNYRYDADAKVKADAEEAARRAKEAEKLNAERAVKAAEENVHRIEDAIKNQSYITSRAKKDLVKGNAAFVFRIVLEIITIAAALFFLVGTISLFAEHEIGGGIFFLVLLIVFALCAIKNTSIISDIQKDNKNSKNAIAREAELASELQEAERKLAEAERKLDNFR